ncbi:macro domain-containing protein [Streptomyces sp. NPDC051104]|uniref:macro domain-containing protein n=1 Tax=Streptomyces sp. NPDC051104 TaxID=3155044 RepID=UPI00342B9B45
MSPLQLCLTALLILSGVGLQAWSSAPARAGRHYALQLPVTLLYSLAGALFLFATFPDSISEGRALGFSLGGAAGFAAFFMLASFTWLSKTRGRDEMAAELQKVKTENAALRRQLLGERAPGRPARPLVTGTRHEVAVPGVRGHRVGMVTGNLAGVTGMDVWVNTENTRMEMSRINEPTISATIRYHGGRRDAAGNLIDDTIALELADRMGGQTRVVPGQVLVTGAGELAASHQVKRILHVAAVEGEPGSGFRPVLDLERCVRNVLAEVDRLNDAGEELRSVVLPLLGTGGGNSDLRKTAETLVAGVVGYFRSHVASRVRAVYLLAYTDVQAAVCRAVLDLEAGLAEPSPH